MNGQPGVLTGEAVRERARDRSRRNREDVGEELADVAIYLLSLAEMTGIDLQDEIEAKMAKNAARVYQRLPNGVLASHHPRARP
jgi:NTP pyrophosphatase (non-canonical NTP hydrolase)